MKVFITGATGDVGKVLVNHLLTSGYTTKLIGLEPDIAFDADYSRCDIEDFDSLKAHMQGCDAVVHLAAIRTPSLAAPQEVFRVNIAGTFNVYEAAAQLGIKRVVQASSINAIGCGWSIDEIHPQYFPIDEQHPRVTNDVYSLSKQMIEDVADYFYRRDGISGTSLRFPWVYNRTRDLNKGYFENQQDLHKILSDMLNMSKGEQQKKAQALLAEARRYRQSRPLEYAAAQTPDPSGSKTRSLLEQFVTVERYTFWTFLDDRDAAQAIEKSLCAEYEGHHTLFVNDSHNNTGLNSEALLKLFYPEVSKRTKTITDSETLVSINKARTLIGFIPEYSLHGNTGDLHD